MIVSTLAQASGVFDTAFTGILAQYGAIAFLLAVVGFMVFLTWRSSEDARTRRQLSEIERTKEDTKRDSVINDYASKYGELSQIVGTQGIALAKAEGKVDLLSNQLEAERERRQKEHEELKGVIRDLSTKLKANEETVAQLKEELNGKLEEIKSLRLERDSLHDQLKDRDVLVQQLQKDIEVLRKEKARIEALIKEQSEQIVSLAKQVTALEDAHKTTFDVPPAQTTTISATSVTITQEDVKKEVSNETTL